MSDVDSEEIDWSLTTWEGARREQLRRWAALPLERIVLALEEMQELARASHLALGGLRHKVFMFLQNFIPKGVASCKEN